MLLYHHIGDMKNKKYTDEKIQEIISPFGFILDLYIDSKNIYAHDSDGYKYHFSLSNLSMGRQPHWIMRNPFALENIRIYLNKEFPYYELLDDEYISCKTKMKFICHKHMDKGIQLNTIDNIANNHHACKFCGYENLRYKNSLPEKQLKELCEKKNVIYIGRTNKNGQTYIIYQCPQHLNDGNQEMSLDHFRASENPCRFCSITAGEQKIKRFLESNGIQYSFQHIFSDCKNIRVLEFDFYIPLRKTVVEFDGKQHYEPMSYYKTKEENMAAFRLSQHRDQIKNTYCHNHNIRMIRIPYWEYKNIEEILRKELFDIKA